jgi:hypothetical protein
MLPRIKTVTLLILVVLSVRGQTNQSSVTNRIPPSQRVEQMRLFSIEGRRLICGKIVKLLPGGLVIESGYTNLLRAPLNRSWLVPATVNASRAADLVETQEPGSVCEGLVFLTDLPKSRRLKPKIYDYVVIEGYPAGKYTYTSVGSIQRTVRRFSAVLEKSVVLNLQSSLAK